MAEGCGTKLARCVLFFINFLVWFGCFCLVASGIAMLTMSSFFDSVFAEDNVFAIAALLILVGGFGFMVGFCGCCGVLTNNRCLLKTYVALMVAVVAGEITGGTLLLVYRDDVEASMTNGMSEAIHNDYGVTDAATEAIDFIQFEFNCCGARSPSDYIGSQYRLENGLTSLPDTCCDPEITPGTCSRLSLELHKEGCVEETIECIQDSILIVGILCFSVIVLEIMTMGLACCLLTSVKDSANYAYKNFS